MFGVQSIGPGGAGVGGGGCRRPKAETSVEHGEADSEMDSNYRRRNLCSSSGYNQVLGFMFFGTRLHCRENLQSITFRSSAFSSSPNL